jgi:hypothetical protein
MSGYLLSAVTRDSNYARIARHVHDGLAGLNPIHRLSLPRLAWTATSTALQDARAARC